MQERAQDGQRERPRRADEPAEVGGRSPTTPADAVLALQRSAGNAAVSRLLARDKSTLQQGVFAIAGGGAALAAAAYMKQNVAWRNAYDHVPELDSAKRPMGAHLGPSDALRHCTWSALVMMQALIEDSPEERLLDTISNLAVPRPPSPSEFLSTSPVSGTHLFPTSRERARAVLMSHEMIGAGPKSPDSQMDQGNNEVGMSLAEGLFKQRKRSDADVCAAAREALDTGKLKMFDMDGVLVSTVGWRDLNPETWTYNLYLEPNGVPTSKQPRPRTRAEAAKAAGTPPTP